jgi:CelD/BcsL family acetyltransferase involved in cellulose biosynthesis
MDVALSYRPVRDDAVPLSPRSAAAIARVEVFSDMAAAEPHWRKLERAGAVATSYQRFDMLAAWQRHVGARVGVRPFIVTAFDAGGEPMVLWPLGASRVGAFGVAHCLGGKHANLNFGLWRREVAAAMDARTIRDVLRHIRAAGHGIDLLTLTSQPESWDGIANPFALLPHQASADWYGKLTIDPSEPDVIGTALSNSMRSRLRTKERKLQKLAGYRYHKATDPADIDRLLDGFLALKAIHMPAQGLRNVFAEPGVADFLREACHSRLPNGDRLIEIHALEGGGEILAVFGATVDANRFSLMINTYTTGEHARHSPGLIILLHILADCAARGVRSFDIGAGRASYKDFFCKEPEPLFDSFLPLTARGHLLALACRASFAAKRTIKNSDVLWSAVQTLRRARSGQKPGESKSD